MHVRAIVCTVLYDGRALTTVARLHRMNIKYKRYRSRRGWVFVLRLSLLSRFPSAVYIFVGRVIAHERCTPNGRGQEPRIIAIIIVSVCNGISTVFLMIHFSMGVDGLKSLICRKDQEEFNLLVKVRSFFLSSVWEEIDCKEDCKEREQRIVVPWESKGKRKKKRMFAKKGNFRRDIYIVYHSRLCSHFVS